jgi:hypothetical protein
MPATHPLRRTRSVPVGEQYRVHDAVYYNPANGPLLIDTQVTSFVATSGQFDVVDCTTSTCVTSNIFGTPLGIPTATGFNFGGNFTQITYSTVAAFFSGEINLGSGVLDPLPTFTYTTLPAATRWFTSNTLFPYLYDFTLNNWLYYFHATNNPGHHTSNPRYFSDLTTGLQARSSRCSERPGSRSSFQPSSFLSFSQTISMESSRILIFGGDAGVAVFHAPRMVQQNGTLQAVISSAVSVPKPTSFETTKAV